MSTLSFLIPVLTQTTPRGRIWGHYREKRSSQCQRIWTHAHPTPRKLCRARKLTASFTLLNVPEKIPLRKNVGYHYRKELSFKKINMFVCACALPCGNVEDAGKKQKPKPSCLLVRSKATLLEDSGCRWASSKYAKSGNTWWYSERLLGWAWEVPDHSEFLTAGKASVLPCSPQTLCIIIRQPV